MAHNAMSHTDCGGCKMMLGNNDKPFDLDISFKHMDDFQLLNRGGFTYRSNGLFTVIQCGFPTFNMCIFKKICPIRIAH